MHQRHSFLFVRYPGVLYCLFNVDTFLVCHQVPGGRSRGLPAEARAAVRCVATVQPRPPLSAACASGSDASYPAWHVDSEEYCCFGLFGAGMDAWME